MTHTLNHAIRRSRFVWAGLLTLLMAVSSCSRSHQAATQSTTQKTFASPEDAGAALVTAAKSGNPRELTAIFGPDSKQALLTGDSATDQSRLKAFVTAYAEMHRWAPIKAGGQVLQVGAENEVFPIPLDRNSAGQWYFDTAAGKDEILARRIGKNELTAMDAVKAIAGAERKYHQKFHQYAQKLASDPGKHDGLYWAAAPGQPASPLAETGEFTQALSATTERDKPFLFNGYYYRILNGGKATHGFTVIAYPAEYRDSGLMSFLMSDNGALYQTDLGENTTGAAASLTSADASQGWTLVSGDAKTASRMLQ